MERISVFDMFKIGVGPSSSHTMGPWRAAERFLRELRQRSGGALPESVRIRVDLFGSLAKTGKGHGTDIAVQLGLAGCDPETIDVGTIATRIAEIAGLKTLALGGETEISFDPNKDVVFHFDQTLPEHPNGMRISATVGEDRFDRTYFSIGGGFVVCSEDSAEQSEHRLPFPIETAADLLAHCGEKTIAEIVLENERTWRDDVEISRALRSIRDVMVGCVHRGCREQGILPGGLNVHRRSHAMAQQLLGQACPDSLSDFLASVRAGTSDFQRVLDWVSCFALAVNEENAAFGRVVTAPTNGAAGVIPAVLLYCISFCRESIADFNEDDVCEKFLLVAGEIGSLFKKGATISAAMGGCQAEIGVSSAMAAAALTEVLGGTPAQAVEAAEIAMEHHLGMTCDPIGGLVQIPCIERNAMGAIKAITASQMALQRDPAHARVSLDDVIRTMWETAQDMNAKYKETSEGGLATQISVNVSEC